MKVKLILFALMMAGLNVSAQTKPNYANLEITIPANYTVNDLPESTELTSSAYTAQWRNLPNILYENNVHRQIIKKWEDETHGRFISAISFTSKGAKMTGKLYQLKVKEGIRYKIFAYGVVNSQPVVLNLGFEKMPRQNSDLDELMRNFITFEK